MNRYIARAEIPQDIGRVTIQAKAIPMKSLQLTLFFSRKKPTKTTEPTRQCVVEMGRPALLAINTVIAAPNSMHIPLKMTKHN